MKKKLEHVPAAVNGNNASLIVLLYIFQDGDRQGQHILLCRIDSFGCNVQLK